MNIPFVDLFTQYNTIKKNVDEAIFSVIKESAFIGGVPVKKFEQEFSKIYGVKNVVSCGNGTDSLYILLKMLGIGEGDEVITVSNSWISSSETITQTGAKPVFVDIDCVYYSINEQLIEKAITSRTKALIAVHLHGQMCEIEIIKRICDNRGIFLIEDCAQSHFSEYKGVRAGLTGIAGSFSFYPGKNLGAFGDAGCIITNDDSLAERCKMFANHGALKKHHHIIEGINSRMDGIQAAILTAKLPYILKWTEQRIKNASLYSQYLSNIEGIHIPAVRPGSKHTFHLYVIRAKDRDNLRSWLTDRGIETFIHYPTPLPALPCYEYLGHNAIEEFSVSMRYSKEILSLPLYPEMTEAMIVYVCNSIKKFSSENKKNGPKG